MYLVLCLQEAVGAVRIARERTEVQRLLLRIQTCTSNLNAEDDSADIKHAESAWSMIMAPCAESDVRVPNRGVVSNTLGSLCFFSHLSAGPSSCASRAAASRSCSRASFI